MILPNTAKCTSMLGGSAEGRSVCRDELYKEDGSACRVVVGQYMEEVKRAFGRAHDFTTGRPISIMPSTLVHTYTGEASRLHDGKYIHIWITSPLYQPKKEICPSINVGFA